jgi:large subunit ribosomal protein L9
MEIILLERVDNLGRIGDRVNVKSGFGRNYLLPKGKATLATPENIAIFEARRAEFEAKHAEELAASQTRADKLADVVLSITAKSGPEGKLFGSLGTIDIAEALAAQGIEIERSEVRMPDGPLRAVGEYDIEIHLHTDIDASIKVNVVGDQDSIAVFAEIEAADADPVDDADAYPDANSEFE